MSWYEAARVAAPLLAAVGPLAASILGGADRERKILASDADLLTALPEGPARNKLLVSIESRIDAIQDPNRRRDYPMLVVSMLAAPPLAFAAVWAFQQGTDNWLWYFAGTFLSTLALIFVFGIFETARVVPRDDTGKALTDQTPRDERGENELSKIIDDMERRHGPVDEALVSEILARLNR